ncbi:MAG: hypothetical protein WAO13_10625 [Pseudolabrys sp.]
MKRLHLDPLDVFHWRDKFRDPLDVSGIIRKTWDERESDPHRLPDRSKTLGESQSWSEVADRSRRDTYQGSSF